VEATVDVRVCSTKELKAPVAVIKSDPQGRYRIVLPPGHYCLTGRSVTGHPDAVPKFFEAVVKPQTFTELTISFRNRIM
jgi:hypothetical protein